ANRVGLVDARGRPTHVLAVPEQFAEQKRLLTRKERREFVALARGRTPGLCRSFEVRPAVGPEIVEAFRRSCAARAGRPRADVERTLQERVRRTRDTARATVNAATSQKATEQAKENGRTTGAAERARSKKPGFAERQRREPGDDGQLPLGGLEPK